MKIRQNGVDITKYVTSVEWEGSSEQVSRSVTYTVANNPNDKGLHSPAAVLGDIVTFYPGEKRQYIGIVTSREKKSDLGDISVGSKDFLHYLIRDKYSGTFKNTTAEHITQRVCSAVGIKTKNLAKTGIHIKKMLAEGESIYGIIVRAYNKASVHRREYYMPKMDGTKLTVVEKWKPSGVELSVNMESISYSENSDEMINQVVIYDSKGKKIGEVKNQQSINRYGKYQDIYTKEKGVNSKTAALKMLKGITKELSVRALGNVDAVAGTSLKIKDKATGVTGTFYITSDRHTWENGTHMMDLTLQYAKSKEVV